MEPATSWEPPELPRLAPLKAVAPFKSSVNNLWCMTSCPEIVME
jgi:hypothetical protein